MTTIWKFTLEVDDDVQERHVPIGATLVETAMQGGQVAMWYQCDPHATREGKWYRVVGTGHPIEPGEHYRGTAHDGRGFVWHVVERVGE